MKTLGIGLIGSGFMGRCHVNAYNSIASIFEVSIRPVLKILADATPELASQQAKALQFEQSTADWQELVNHPEVDVVDITAPNHLHHPIAIAALNLGKPVYCEKPLACTLAEAEEMANLAKASMTTDKTAKIDAGVKLSVPGRMISIIPINPKPIAIQLPKGTLSRRKKAAPKVTSNGENWRIADAELSCELTTAMT